MLKSLFGCLVVLVSCGFFFADVHPPDDERPYDEQLPAEPPYPLPWLTGPLLTPSGHVIPVGHINMEPYLFGNIATGIYNSHWRPHSTPNFYNVNTQVPVQFGIFPRWDFQLTPSFSWNHFQNASHWEWNDLPFLFDFQIYYDSPTSLSGFPAVKLTFRANAPIGKYQHLNPNKKGTDIGGSGSWEPGIELTFSRLFHFTGVHYLATRLNFTYIVPTPVHVRGFNAYGGGHGTAGKAYPGATFVTLLGLEYTLAQKWALALDAVYAHGNRTHFSGQKGKTNGVTNSISAPSSEQFSLAPAFEYNWNANCGLIAGCWFSVAGRNTARFVNPVIAINIYQ